MGEDAKDEGAKDPKASGEGSEGTDAPSETPPRETPAEAVEEAIAEGPPPSARAAAPPALARAAWAAPLARLDRSWTRLEARLCAAVLIGEILSLCMWITLKGLAAGYSSDSEDKSGLVLRGLLGAVILGYAAHRATRARLDEKRHAVVVTVAVVVGLVGARAWANTGAAYFGNVLNWMQSASVLALIGGLRGLATRLTLWVALLGASLATAAGKHINIDVVMRFLSPKWRVPVAVIGWAAGTVMCVAAVWGFVDHIAIENFHAPAVQPCPGDANKECDVPAGAKLDVLSKDIGRDTFLLGRQISLDFKTLPKVVAGKKFDEWLHPADWNAWIDAGGWESHFPKADVDGLKMPTEGEIQARPPIITVPGGESAPGLLVKELNFVFPLGMLMIALRFVLRSLLVLGGWARVDPDAAHGEEEVEDAQLEQHGKNAPKGAAS